MGSELTYPQILARAFAEFRMNLRQILFENGVVSNPGWSEDDILASLRQLLGKRDLECFSTDLHREGQVSNFYLGGNPTEAYVIAGIMTGMLHEYGLSGRVTVTKDEKLVLEETWENGFEIRS